MTILENNQGAIKVKEFIKTIGKIPEFVWREADELSWKRNDGLSQLGWLHNKGYLRSETNKGELVQTDTHGNKEIPCKRELFYPSPEGRFSLGKYGEVTYISNDFITNNVETDHVIKNKQMTLNEYDDYLIHGCADSKLFFYPIPISLSCKAKILNFKSDDNPLINYIADKTSIEKEEFFKTVILGKERDCYYITQLIALAAYSQGFQGILYKSVRELSDVTCPDSNIVVFEREIIKHKKY